MKKIISSIHHYFARVFNAPSTTRLALPLGTAAFVGVATGIIIVFFVKCIDVSHDLFFGKGQEILSFLNGYGVILIPAIGGLLVGLLVYFFAPEAGGHGVPEVMKAIALKGGKISPLPVIIKFITSIITIGSGGSVGREGPAVFVGSGMGSLTGQALRLNEARVKNLLACGTAAGISAVFNAPITGVMFALEIILKDFGARALSTVVVASVAGSIVSRIFLGESPAFIIPVYKLTHPFEILPYVGLGFLCAIAALIFIISLDRIEWFFDKWKIPGWMKPAIGGLAVGCIGFFYPQVFGMGFEAIETALHGRMDISLLCALVIFKMLATSFTLGSGNSGGTFAPVLFVGAALGGAFGQLIQGQLPFPTAPAGAYALVGMASVFAGAFHAPVTAILLVFEMTSDYQIILPIMIAAVISTSIAQLVMSESIDTVKLKRTGININQIEEARFLGAIQVSDAMNADFVTVHQDISAKELVEKMSVEKDKSFMVIDDHDRLVGVIHASELKQMMLEQDLSSVIADDVASPPHETCFPSDPLSEVAHLMLTHRLSQIPVLNPGDPSKVIGVVRSEDVFKAYTHVSEQRRHLMSRIEQEETHPSGMIQIHFNISTRCSLNEKKVKDLGLPDGVVLTTIQRKKATLIPEGLTVLKAKDRIWAVVLPESETAFKEWLTEHKLKPTAF